MLWFCGEYLGVKNVPAGIMFFEIAGWLSVLEHDKFERALPFGMWKANEHHMHHAFVKCNYAPYSALWDKVFGTWKPFKQTTAEARRVAYGKYPAAATGRVPGTTWYSTCGGTATEFSNRPESRSGRYTRPAVSLSIDRPASQSQPEQDPKGP